ncbi:MAG: tRNA (guanosine(46)-N7)-methyltransferase TrmB [Oscillospiraceae bacterium]|nr:tRNA (guanosine(46)-N7)-methyltransferase TrmB [Oscillospiraceae bacterium]
MRMRKKPNLIPRMEKAAAVLEREPEKLRGRWLEACPGHTRLYLELGCGKGGFTCAAAREEPEALFAAVERVPDAMVVAMERACEMDLHNVRFLDADAARLTELFAPGEADRIYINFCDPWPKKKQFKRRLTAPGFLALYRQILKPEGEIWFKTDNRDLFDWSEEQLLACGWQVSEVTRDLHANGPVGIMTDYEKKFYGEGKPICRLTARAK